MTEDPEHTSSTPLKPVILGLVGALALAIALYFGEGFNQPLPNDCANLPLNKILGGDFSLPSTSSHVTKLSDTNGKVRLLNFGFTYCPDVCPTVLARMAAAANSLEKDYAISPDRFANIFITFDHERDTMERLQEYLPFFHQDFIGFTGTAEEILPVTRAYGVFFQKDDHGSEAGYGFSHSDYIYLLDRDGFVRKLYGADASNEEIVNDMRCLM